jgi:hypothetical protein
MARRFAVALVLLAAVLSSPAARSLVIDYSATIAATPGPACAPVPVPLDCTITSVGTYTDLSGTFGPWTTTAVFTIFSAGQPSPTSFLSAGTFLFDDTTPANNDIVGSFTGVFDAVTLFGVLTYAISGGSGAFAGATGTGTGLIQVLGLGVPVPIVERGTLLIPEPASLALLCIAMMALLAFRRARRERRIGE